MGKAYNLAGGSWYPDGDTVKWGKNNPNLKVNKDEIKLTPEKPSDTITITSDSDGIIQVENPIPNSISTQVNGKVITFTKGAEYGHGEGAICLLKTNNFRSAFKSIKIQYESLQPNAQGGVIDIQQAYQILGEIKGKITFSRGKASNNVDRIYLNNECNVMAVIEGNNATIYSEYGNGVFAPTDSGGFFCNGAGRPNPMSPCPYAATSYDLWGLDTSRVKIMKGFFRKCSVGTLDVSPLNTSLVTSVQDLFNQAEIGSLVGLEKLDFSSVVNTQSMFQDCQYPDGIIDLSNLNMSQVTNSRQMFKNCQASKIYCRTQSDAELIKATEYFPGITVEVKS